MAKLNPHPRCHCGLLMYLVGHGEGVFMCRDHDDHPDLPPPTGAWWATGSEWDDRYEPTENNNP